MPSLFTTVERLAMRLLPPKVTESLQRFKHELPLKLHLSAPVVQLYLDDAHTRSFVGLNNFYSFLLADIETSARVQLRFHDSGGGLVLRHSLDLAHFAARAVDVRALFDHHRIRSPFGVVTAQITPTEPRRKVYRDLGRASAQFFMFYRDDETGSVEQVHPLSTADRDNRPSAAFLSSQVISTHKVRQVIAFQYNPSSFSHSLEHSLVNAETGEPVASRRATIPPMGSTRAVFTLADLANLPARLSLAVDALPSANSKPMLRRVFDGGRHSMSHS
jgi:hypothetical protein